MGIGKNIIAKLFTRNSGVQFTFPGSIPGMVHISLHFLNGISKNMAINGASTTVEFEVAPPNDKIYDILFTPLLIIAGTGSMDPEKFGTRVVLPNGFQMIAEQNGVETLICEAKDNKDLALCFFEGQLGTGPSAGSGFFNTGKYGIGSHEHTASISLNGATNDRLFIKVQDDLSAIAHLEATCEINVLPL